MLFKLLKVALFSAVACITAVPFPSFAAYWDWKCKASGVSYFDDTGCWYKSGATTFANSNHNISNAQPHHVGVEQYDHISHGDGSDRFGVS